MHRVNFESRVVVQEDIAAGTVGHIAEAGEVLHIAVVVVVVPHMVVVVVVVAAEDLRTAAAAEGLRIAAAVVFRTDGEEAEVVVHKTAVQVEAGHRATADKEIGEDPDLGLEMVVPVTWPIQDEGNVAAGKTADRVVEANRMDAAAQGIVGYTVDSCLFG